MKQRNAAKSPDWLNCTTDENNWIPKFMNENIENYTFVEWKRPKNKNDKSACYIWAKARARASAHIVCIFRSHIVPRCVQWSECERLWYHTAIYTQRTRNSHKKSVSLMFRDTMLCRVGSLSELASQFFSFRSPPFLLLNLCLCQNSVSSLCAAFLFIYI